MPLLYYTNAMFYDNLNKTLPIGMNLCSKVLIDNKRLEFVLVNKTKFRTNSYFNKEADSNPKSKDIFVYEYDVFLKDESAGNTRNELLSASEPHVPENALEVQLEQEENAFMNTMEEVSSFEEETMEEEILENIEAIETLEEMSPERKEEISSEILVQETFAKMQEDKQEEIGVNQSKKLLKIQQKLEKELEKQKKKEEKIKQKLEKKSKRR